MRKLLVLSLCLAMVLACTGGTLAEEQEFDVWYITKTRSQAFSTWVVTVFEEQLAANYPNIHLSTYDGQESFETRAALMEDCIAQHPDMLILQYFDENEVPMIQEVIDAGIPVCVTNGQYTTDPDLCSYVDIDPYEQGAMVAKYAAEHLPENAKVVLMEGVAGNQHSEARVRAFEDYVFNVRDDVELLASANCDWDRAMAMNTMEDWIQAFPEIDAVLTCYDEMGLGAMEALIAADRIEGMQIYGTDALAGACLAIKDGTYTATVLQDGNAIALGAIQVMVDTLINGNTEQQMIYTETPLITAENVDDMIKTHLQFNMLSENDLSEYGWSSADFGL